MTVRRVFVTGANGRIGQALVGRLIQDGHTVVGLARSEEKAEQVRKLGASCAVASLGEPAAIRQALAGATHVLHLAGGLRGPGDATPDRLNRETAEQLVAAITDEDSIQRVVFTSSCAVYGDRSGLWVNEEMPPHPNTDYGASKVAAEQVLQTAAEHAGWSLSIVRLAAVYGLGFPWLMDDRIRAGKGWLPGEGRNFVPTIHVDDAVEGLSRIAFSDQAADCYNLADPEPVMLRDFYAAVHGCVGGQPMRFWSTWIPSYVQFRAARANERLVARMGSAPRFTPDNLRLFTASVRMKVDRLADDLGMTWAHRNAPDGIRSLLTANL